MYVNSATSQVKVHSHQALRHSAAHICCTKSFKVGKPENAIFVSQSKEHVDAHHVVFLLMARLHKNIFV